MCLHFSFVSDDILEVNFINKYDQHHNYNFRSYCQAVNFRYVITSVCTCSLPLRYCPVTRLQKFIL